MEVHVTSRFSPATSRVDGEQLVEVKKGPWTADEDALLMNYVSVHGEGRWNSIARFAGLNRTGKSCRLRWLNYLRPDLCRGSITLQEQLLILELHSRWGNRWSKIAQYLPGRTDNEIKNYWRTRVQKQAKQLKCDVNSKQFRDAMHNVWMPRLREQIESSSTGISPVQPTDTAIHATEPVTDPTGNRAIYQRVQSRSGPVNQGFSSEIPAMSSSDSCSDTAWASLVSDPSEHYDPWDGSCIDSITEAGSCSWPESLFDYPGLGSGGIEYEESNYCTGEVDLMMENLWNDESIWLLQQQLFDGMDGNCTDR